MARGFYQKEILHPHFTTDAYKRSDAYRHEVELEKKIERFVWHTPKAWVKRFVKRILRLFKIKRSDA